jgi:hypothetical protein
MSRHPAWGAVDKMELDIRDLGLWASILNRMGTTEDPIDPEDVWVISNVLSAIAKRLDANRREAFGKVGGVA